MPVLMLLFAKTTPILYLMQVQITMQHSPGQPMAMVLLMTILILIQHTHLAQEMPLQGLLL